MITRLQPTISKTGIRYILDNQGREIASISSLLDGIDNVARAKEEEYVHNAICDSFNRIAALEADKAKLIEVLGNVLEAYNGCQCGCDPDNAWHEARAVLAEVTK